MAASTEEFGLGDSWKILTYSEQGGEVMAVPAKNFDSGCCLTLIIQESVNSEGLVLAWSPLGRGPNICMERCHKMYLED